jgi:RimJ/RimL family protein N-acetyltransferase
MHCAGTNHHTGRPRACAPRVYALRVTEPSTTERLILRQWRADDRAPFQAINADPRVMEFFPGTLHPWESDEVFERIQRHFERHGFGLWAAELRADRSFLGFIGLAVPNFDAPFMPAVEIGWRLRSDVWNRGLATEGAREAMRFAFQELRLASLVSMTVPANLRSRRVMEKLGMTRDERDDFDHPLLPVGHPLRRHVLYRLDRQAWRADPQISR